MHLALEVLAYAAEEGASPDSEGRRNGAWTQRYEYGVPVIDLVQIDDDETTGTTVHFLPAAAIPSLHHEGSNLALLATWLSLRVEIVDEH